MYYVAPLALRFVRLNISLLQVLPCVRLMVDVRQGNYAQTLTQEMQDVVCKYLNYANKIT